MNDQSFSSEQQEYLKGFMSGVEARRTALGLPATPGEAQAAPDPKDLQRAAQDRIRYERGWVCRNGACDYRESDSTPDPNTPRNG